MLPGAGEVRPVNCSTTVLRPCSHETRKAVGKCAHLSKDRSIVLSVKALVDRERRRALIPRPEACTLRLLGVFLPCLQQGDQAMWWLALTWGTLLKPYRILGNPGSLGCHLPSWQEWQRLGPAHKRASTAGTFVLVFFFPLFKKCNSNF